MTELAKNPIEGAASTGFNRRTVIKAAAWSAPVVAVAVAAPMAAASIESTSTPTVSGGTSASVTSWDPDSETGTFSGAYLSPSASVTNSGVEYTASTIEMKYQVTGPVSARKFFSGGTEIIPSTGNTTVIDGWLLQRTSNGTITAVPSSLLVLNGLNTWAPPALTVTGNIIGAPDVDNPISVKLSLEIKDGGVSRQNASSSDISSI
jgi:hypothetical protein